MALNLTPQGIANAVKQLPTFLNKAGQWVSSDNTLNYKAPAPAGPPAPKPNYLKNTIEPFIAGPRERLGAVKESVKQKSLAPLRESFNAQNRAMFPQPGDDPKTFTDKTIGLSQIVGLAAPGSGGKPTGGKKPPAKGTPEIPPKVPPDVPPKAEIAPGKRERGFVTSVKEEFPNLTKVAGQYIPRETDPLAVKARNLIKSDIAEAERLALNFTDDKAVATAAELIKHYNTQIEASTDFASRSALNERVAEIANTTARNLTEHGRAIQAASILSRLTPEGQIKFAAREIQKYNEALDKTKGGIGGLRKKVPELSGSQADYIVTEMKAIGSMPDGSEKAIRYSKLQDYISSLVPSSLYQKILAVWKAGLLTGVKTSGLNIFSNLNHAISERIKDVPAVAVDSVASLFTGKRTIGLTMKGTGTGLKEGFEKGLRYLKTGYDERNIGAKLDYKKVNFGKSKIGQAFQKYEETVFRIIGAEDQPFYYGAKARSLMDQALAEGNNKGLKGAELKTFVENLVQNPTDDMVRYAVLDAETAVFQNSTVLGRAAKKIQEIPGAEFVVPFGKTPSAVATQVINYTPVGVAKTIIENIGKGRFDQRLFSQGVGRGLTGTGILFIGGVLASKGLVSLDRPTTESEQELWRLEGRTPNSIKIGNKWRTAQVLGPAGSLLIVGAHFQNALKETGSPTEAMLRSVSGGLKSFTEQTFLQGLNQVVEALNDPSRFLEGYASQLFGSVVPTLVSDVARASDTTERRISDTGLGSIGEKIFSRLPGLRQTLEPQVTFLGKNQSRAGNILETLADPTRPSRINSSPLVNEFRRLKSAGQSLTLTKLGEKKGFKALTPEENTRLWQRSGEILEAKLTNLINHPDYSKLDDSDKADSMQDVIDKSKLIARVEMVLQLTEGLQGEELKAKLSELKQGKILNKEVFEKFQELR